MVMVLMLAGYVVLFYEYVVVSTFGVVGDVGGIGGAVGSVGNVDIDGSSCVVRGSVMRASGGPDGILFHDDGA